MSDENDPASSATSSPPAKYSRYRSVRQPVKKEDSVPEQKPEPEMARTKSMSRYRRTRIVSKTDQVAASSMPPVPAIPRANAPALSSNPPAQRYGTRRVTEPIPSPHNQQRPAVGNAVPGRPRETDEERMRRMGREAHEREDKLRRERKEKEEQDRIARQQQAEAEAEQARKAAEDAANRLAEQKRKDLERLQAELDAAVPTSPPLPTSPRDKLRFFSRKRAPTKTTPPTTAERESGSASLSTTKSNEPPRGIEQGGGGIVPQIDAPISASNAGERVSCVWCRKVEGSNRFSESSHSMQAILNQSSNNSRNHSCRYYLFCRQYHDAKYHSFYSCPTRIVYTTWT